MMTMDEEVKNNSKPSDDECEAALKWMEDKMANQDHFKIWLNLLRDGSTQQLELEMPASYMAVDDPALSFKKPVFADGEAYIAGDELIMHLNAKTEATIPCSICSEPVIVPLECNGFYHAVPLSEIKGNFYDFRDIVRENLLLEVPLTAECGGKCPERAHLKKYFKQGESKVDPDEGQQRPFSNLSL